MAKREKEERAFSILRTLIAVLVVLALATATLFVFNYYRELGDARLVLYEAKSARLAAWSVSNECIGTNRKFSDVTTESGFTDAVAENVQELSQTEGEIRLLQTDKNGYDILAMTYEKNGYLAEFSKSGEEETWQVSRVTAMITA